MLRRPPGATRTAPLFPDTTLFRSHEARFGVEVHRAGIEVERADEQPLAIHCKGLGVQHRGAGPQHRAIAAAAAARAGAEEAAPGPLSLGALGPAHLATPHTRLETIANGTFRGSGGRSGQSSGVAENI